MSCHDPGEISVTYARGRFVITITGITRHRPDTLGLRPRIYPDLADAIVLQMICGSPDPVPSSTRYRISYTTPANKLSLVVLGSCTYKRWTSTDIAS